MIWLDIIDPKYVLFFKDFIPYLKLLDEVLITTRKSPDYSECAKLLDLFKIPNIVIGSYGGQSLEGKFEKRLQRQKSFLKLFKKYKSPNLFITGASVDGTQCAYGLGIPIIQFSDTPIKDEVFSLEKITLLSRLTLPLSSLIFHPFIVPQICYTSLGIPTKNIIPYDFIDVALWLKNFQPQKDFRDNHKIPKNKPTILIREEEYKAHYVDKKLPIIYESVSLLCKNLDINIIIMPRYESQSLKKSFKSFKNIYIIEEKLKPNEFYPYIDILIGGGGTMNLEACYLGIPTISTRSLFLFHDRYLLKHKLMKHCKSPQEVFKTVEKILQNPQVELKKSNKKLFEPKEANFDGIFKTIKDKFYA
ncbi:DUF354 domain-containing protein [Helicobacter sp. 13S00477-4]|uniref:DUF354 domain-containing protein n=1 Tax=Helicobacter sp. 13S00477-4 TaxID=1905759 RepID=UPI000BA74796|nr:DUF354 domain-containing protein [Helicobacter sp. 13S00477-4]PAF52448.1 hypothetical protein BKH44_02690 [Helicobacter sp. 13S00477-4]